MVCAPSSALLRAANLRSAHPKQNTPTQTKSYIYTRLAPLTRRLFHASDDKLLDYLVEEGQSIEPSW